MEEERQVHSSVFGGQAGLKTAAEGAQAVSGTSSSDEDVDIDDLLF